MRMEITQSLRPELQQKLTPQLLQSIKILQLSTIDLEQYLREELEKNPTLEMVENKPSTEETEISRDEVNLEDGRPMGADGNLQNDFSQLESLSVAYSDYFPTSRGEREYGESDKKMEALQNTAAPPISLHDHLVEQLHLLDISEELIRIGEEIIYNLDENGYLPYSLEEIQKSMKGEVEVSLEDAEKALKYVQSLDPPGVGGRDMKECLLIQLGDSQNYRLERLLIDKFLEDIEKNRLPKIAKDTGEDLELIIEAVDFIRKLDPKPGSLFNTNTPQYIQPDVVIEEAENGYEVHIEDSSIPHIHISPRYQKMLEENGDDPEVRKFVKKKIESAKWFLESLQQRNNTLNRISQEIVDYQKNFFREGISHLKPLIMQDIAEKLSIHVSTVSRAISGKYIQTPQGIFGMSFFFTGGTNREDGEVESTLSIKERIARIIEQENKKHPLCDDQIAEKLKREGLNIARRTVTKYRTQMKIPSSRQRKEY